MSAGAVHTFFATTGKGMEELLAAEVRELGAARVALGRGGVTFDGTLEVAYRACLWSRVANRVLLSLAEFAAPTPSALYYGVRAVRWADHLRANRTLAVDCATSESRIGHSHYAALKTKDAIVDQLREQTGARPSVAVQQPDVRVNLYLQRDRATVSIDLSGDSLHRRGYRQAGGTAPLKENLAAAVLLLADWPRLARARVPLIDPMCGTGTLVVEAALIAADIAPGRSRTYFGFLGWRGHEAALWQRLCAEAESREIREATRLPIIRGYDVDARAVRSALANVDAAGLRGRVHVEKRALADCEPISVPVAGDVRGVVVTNPPYGERLGERAALGELYATLGDTLRHKFLGWTAYVLTGNPDLGKRIGLRPRRRHLLYNGPIECRVLAIPISTAPVREARAPHWRDAPPPTAREVPKEIHHRGHRGTQRNSKNRP